MTLVSAERLNRFMSEPQWTTAMYQEAADILAGVEDELGAVLNAPISGEDSEGAPLVYRETATILGSGLVATTYPVVTVTVLNGTTITGGALPDGWTVRDHWLRAEQVPAPTSFTMWQPLGTIGRTEGVGSVALDYQPGWGDVPALRKAILRKAAAIMTNRHDDTITTRALDATEPPKLTPEEWTDAELEPLGRYRNLVVWR